MIFGFWTGFERRAGNEDKAEVYAQKATEAHRIAAKANPESPVVMVFAGTSLGDEGVEEGSLYKMMAAKALFELAENMFAHARPEETMKTHFNRAWLQFWRPWLDEEILKRQATDESGMKPEQ